MSIFRSEDMNLYEITLPKDHAWDIMDKLGTIGKMHFINLNRDEQVFNLIYEPYIKRCETTQRKIAFIQEECKRYEVDMEAPYSSEDFLDSISFMKSHAKKAGNMFFETIEKEIADKEAFIQEQTAKVKDMHENFNLLYEYKIVLKKAIKMIKGELADNDDDEDDERQDSKDNDSHNSQNSLADTNISVGHIAGTILQQEKLRFKKLVFRATRGNALCYFSDFNKPMKDYYGFSIKKSVYVLVFKEGEVLREKLTRICQSFMGDTFEIPKANFNQKLTDLTQKISDTKFLIQRTDEEMKKYLTSINHIDGIRISPIIFFKWYVQKEKYLYEELNKFKPGDLLLFGLFWAPASHIGAIKNAIVQIKESNINGPQINQRAYEKVMPPSYFRINEFTESFQEIINTYGVPAYKEVNPTVFTIVTFPLLFGVMFGDIAHGFVLLLLGISLCLFSGFFQTTFLKQLVASRYLLTLMGFFATFCGLCYNDFASLPVEFKSCYETKSHSHEVNAVRSSKDCVYSFGVDPVWYLSTNELQFINSMKMKISVILGVAQMTLGIFMKAFNSMHFNKLLDFTFEFIPQLLLLSALFGWMDYLIIAKWLHNWDTVGANPPGVISVMINMFLNFGVIPKGTDPIVGPSQTSISNMLLVIALICIPTMLLVKPLYMYIQHKSHDPPKFEQREDHRFFQLHEEEEKDELAHHDMGRKSIEKLKESNDDFDKLGFDDVLKKEAGIKEDHSFNEIFIHQLIETIEFTLGTVSNTASYLRLWALSLAHSQLSAVFFDKLIKDFALSGKGSSILLVFMFPIYASFTLFVLMCMDSMECFLHTLRLHWVEFQNKFYKGNGYKFNPFSFGSILSKLNAEKF